ncbi:MAG TPA: type II toxin-antitoxin system VapC family toxin [Candidatus Acidoferrum sp.]|nr:type II toxin-antitoxin system VapC family toxin [Candidatus Acidoferrum sp.]
MTTLNGSKKWVVDSSGWIEYLGNGPKAGSYAPYLENSESLLLPTIVVYEVYKKLLHVRETTLAEQFLSQAFSFNAREILIDIPVAALAAKISLELKLAMADAIIYACARSQNAELVTSDHHFEGFPGATVL